MGSQQYVGNTLEDITGRKRLVFEHVDGRATDLSLLERIRQRRIIDDPTARRVDQNGIGFHLGQSLGADEVMGPVRSRHAQADNVRLCQYAV